MHVSVIMPAYNYGRYIGAAIESVLQQTHGSLELLIIDDGSEDDTAEIVGKFADSRVNFVRINNGGVSRARNHGLERARGDAIAFLDADDLWLPQKLESQIRVLTEQPEVGFVATNFVRFREDGTELSDQFTYMPRTVRLASRHAFDGGYCVLPGNALVALCNEGEMPWYPSANLVRRSVVDGLQFPEGLRLGEDLHFFNRIWMRTRGALIPSVGARLRRHESNSSLGAGTTHEKRCIDEFSGLLELDLTKEQAAAVRRRIAMSWAGIGWAARRKGNLDTAAHAYAQACRTGGATVRIHLTRAVIASRAFLSLKT